MKCKFEGCNREVANKKTGLCRTHYMQQWRGAPLTPIREIQLLTKDDDGRVCTACHEYKPWSEFYPHHNAGYRAACKACSIKDVQRRNAARKQSV